MSVSGSAVEGPAAGDVEATRALRWRAVRRVLAVRLDNLGDVLMTTPALAAIRESVPGVHLTLLASPAGALAAPHLPFVDEVWRYAAPWVQRDPANQAEVGPDDAALIDRIARGGFDAAIVFTVCTQSALPAALMLRLAGVPLRLAHSRENPYALLTDWLPETDHVQSGLAHDAQHILARHEAQRQLALVGAVGWHIADDRLRFAVLAADRQRVAARLRNAGVDPAQPYAVIHPGATAASRRWPTAGFGAAARSLVAQGCAAVVSGHHTELALADAVLDAVERDPPPAPRAAAVSLAGMLELGELAALIAGAAVLVANNSAPSHLAAAVGTPVVNLYALTNPQHTPWRVPSRVLFSDVPCRWCLKSTCPQRHHDCLRRVEPERVAQAAFELMRLPQTRAAMEALA